MPKEWRLPSATTRRIPLPPRPSRAGAAHHRSVKTRAVVSSSVGRRKAPVPPTHGPQWRAIRPTGPTKSTTSLATASASTAGAHRAPDPSQP